MQEIQLFKNPEFGEVRTVVKDGEPWFVLRDILNAMKTTTRPADAKNSIVEYLGGGVVINYPLQTTGGPQDLIFVNESALTFILSRGATEESKKLNKWIHIEVLPTIRKTGGYLSPEIDWTNLDQIQKVLDVAKEERAKRIDAEKARDRLIHVSKLYTTTEIAKELGMRSAAELNKKLNTLKIQYKINGTWCLTKNYSEMGLVSTKLTELEAGKIIYERKWTGAGRDFLLELAGK